MYYGSPTVSMQWILTTITTAAAAITIITIYIAKSGIHFFPFWSTGRHLFPDFQNLFTLHIFIKILIKDYTIYSKHKNLVS